MIVSERTKASRVEYRDGIIPHVVVGYERAVEDNYLTGCLRSLVSDEEVDRVY
jgi:hypothetical protein